MIYDEEWIGDAPGLQGGHNRRTRTMRIQTDASIRLMSSLEYSSLKGLLIALKLIVQCLSRLPSTPTEQDGCCPPAPPTFAGWYMTSLAITRRNILGTKTHCRLLLVEWTTPSITVRS
jgi:hypothetical protein